MKMKHLTSLFLALLIFGTRVGFALNVHYCGSKIAVISLAKNSSNCGMKTASEKGPSSEKVLSKTPCCKDAIFLFQNDEPQKIEFERVDVLIASLPTYPLNDFSVNTPPALLLIENLNWNPPPPQKNQLILLQHSFVYYG
ncbi:MAG: hypothetical protein ACI9TK_000602 [Flavobacteriaceae bacterium]|jgi:hypothetical protein